MSERKKYVKLSSIIYYLDKTLKLKICGKKNHRAKDEKQQRRKCSRNRGFNLQCEEIES